MNSKRSVKRYSKGTRMFLVLNEQEMRTLNECAAILKLNTQQTIRKIIKQYVSENKVIEL